MPEPIEDDKTSKTNDTEEFDGEFDAEWGEDDTKGDEDKDKKDDKKDEDKDEDKDKSKSSAVAQKIKYREKLNKALDKIKELEGKYQVKEDKGTLTEDEKKERAANEFLEKKIKEIFKEIKKEEEESTSKEEDAFQEEIDDILEENSDLTEQKLLDACEEYEVSPKKALKIIRDLEKVKGKEKPKIPQPKRGETEVKDENKKDDKSPRTLDQVAREVKESLRKGLYK